MVNIHELHLKDLQNPFHPSVFEEYNDYRLLILRLPDQLGKKTKIHSYGFILTNEDLFYYDKNKADFIRFTEGITHLYHFLDDKINSLMVDIETVQEKIAALESSLYKKFTSTFMDHWHDLKKELSRSERVIFKAVDVLKLFISKSKSTKTLPINEFDDLYEHLERTLRSNVAVNDQLDNLYRYYSLRSTDRMNRSIYILTIISVIFLPLNLVVGFFGMNTGGLPFQHAMGTWDAFVSMIVFAVLLTLGVLWKIKRE
ncbi:MAG: magnesium transporter CorA family protein [Sulfuricurvum sp.]|uniref:magnesium transporter CorA family protein n=1 Tax=Sulfuricurvum sp. TaxID=2025608 RepID=UPI00261D21E9|nr:magnesium transporter CorA family protein [Sulfuricurvum sp.]MDD2829196.1 magnesium transporter CorA family protein [Sulfuricurvum sp.]MDD4949029.1 magnesium transporter CorA family protein [Sulfuricurvum sp.]